MKKVNAATLNGLNASCVVVEGVFHKGLPGFSIVGLPNDAIKESRDRVKAALLSSGYTFPPLKITISLSPSDLSKNGSHFDLPIALMIALQKESAECSDYFVCGELGLDGSVKHTSTLFPLILSLSTQQENLKVVIPKESASQLASIPHITLYPVSTLQEAVSFFQEELKPDPYSSATFDALSLTHDEETYFYTDEYPVDFFEVKGQSVAKRASLIAAAGMHNLLLEGSPGCGKSMTIKRLAHILPPLTHEEMLMCAKLEALEGKEPQFKAKRPYRAPHHSSTRGSIFGGGSRESKIGEIALAHHGVLYFDELPHYDKSVLEALREPLEDHRILISRVQSKIEYPAKFLFAASMNPCPCGNLLSTTKVCRCSDVEILRYKNRLSDPFLDRIDLFVTMNEPKEGDDYDVTSQELHTKVKEAFLFQKQRGQEEFNGKLDEAHIKKYCTLTPEASETLKTGVNRFNLSYRGENKVLRVARTIADLALSHMIEKGHIIEALGYRKR